MKQACEIYFAPPPSGDNLRFSKQYKEWKEDGGFDNSDWGYGTCFEPCFVATVHDTENVAPDDIPFVLEYMAQESGPDQLIFFSLTNKEKNYSAWLEAIEGYPGAAVYEHERGTGNNHRIVYTCIVPVTPKL